MLKKECVSMDRQIRRTVATDYPEICSWITDATVCRQWAGPAIAFPPQCDVVATELVKEGQRSFTLVEGEAVAGFGQFWVIEPGAVHIGRVIVSPRCRSRGIGRYLVQALVAQGMASTGAARATLRVARGNDRAAALYASMGFEAVPERSTPDVLFMQRP
ncbi:GNAT family N-acetyltransferase [Paraburkholderia sp. XV]|uniref:GNAT family N-acetyltransferase n=1 Tax=Paraburkholderia sp. XV TaxID=2831520 RepID=UPI001CD1DD81|nr:GNAT family N-acetyltransferase [Paraburkholderia sp. XV]